MFFNLNFKTKKQNCSTIGAAHQNKYKNMKYLKIEKTDKCPVGNKYFSP